MSGLSQLLQTGLSGLSAASEALQTVANNTANVNTPGYNVQSVNQTELPGTAGGPGAGTDVTSIQRAFSQFLFQQGVQASSANQAAQVIESNAQNLAAIFPIASGGAGGLGSALDSFFRRRTRLPRIRRAQRTARCFSVKRNRSRPLSGLSAARSRRASAASELKQRPWFSRSIH